MYGKAGYKQVGEFLRSESLITTIQLGEVHYILLQEEGREEAQSALVTLKNTDIDIVPVDEELVLEASEIKVSTGIPYVDSVAAGLAQIKSGALVTSDSDFEHLEGHYDLKLKWIDC
ncbi:PIN domain-containing protein [Candidatus Bipolaricaulota bacterium]|nr:PIN domain-containing protein [Candidatus Bipolaricaulota bacterium]